jgi:hypothetical protein
LEIGSQEAADRFSIVILLRVVKSLRRGIAKAAANMLAMIWFGFVIAFFARGRMTRPSEADAIPINT